MEPNGEEKALLTIIKEFKSSKDWIDEVNAVSNIISQLEEMNKAVSIRDLAKLLGRTKTWVGTTLIIMRGLRVYPELSKLNNRYQAYSFIQSKHKKVTHGYRS